jgi:hypothetical protein
MTGLQFPCTHAKKVCCITNVTIYLFKKKVNYANDTFMNLKPCHGIGDGQRGKVAKGQTTRCAQMTAVCRVYLHESHCKIVQEVIQIVKIPKYRQVAEVVLQPTCLSL